jgi:hypothetical protein
MASSSLFTFERSLIILLCNCIKSKIINALRYLNIFHYLTIIEFTIFIRNSNISIIIIKIWVKVRLEIIHRTIQCILTKIFSVIFLII